MGGTDTWHGTWQHLFGLCPIISHTFAYHHGQGLAGRDFLFSLLASVNAICVPPPLHLLFGTPQDTYRTAFGLFTLSWGKYLERHASVSCLLSTMLCLSVRGGRRTNEK